MKRTPYLRFFRILHVSILRSFTLHWNSNSNIRNPKNYIHHRPRLQLFIYPLEYSKYYRISRQIFTPHRPVNEFSNENFIPDRDGGKQETFPSKLIRSKTCSNWRVQLESSDRREYKFPPKQAVAKKEGARRAVSIRNPSPWREITPPPSFPRCFYTRKGRVAIFMSSAARGKTFSGEIGAEMGRDWRGWRAVKRSISAATRRNRDSSLFFSSLLLFALLFDTRVCQLLFHSSPFVSRPWSVFKADTLRSAPVQKRMQSCCARVEKAGEPCASCCFERERETLIFVNRRAWSSSTFGKNLSTYILCPFSSPLRSTFLVFPTFPNVVISSWEGSHCCRILRGLGKLREVSWSQW